MEREVDRKEIGEGRWRNVTGVENEGGSGKRRS